MALTIRDERPQPAAGRRRRLRVGGRPAIATRILLVLGILAPVVFIGTDLAVGSSWRGYDFGWRSINELSAIGSPVRAWAAPLFALVNLLTIAFGVGVWRDSGGYGGLNVLAAVVIANGAFGLAAAFFPNRAGVTPTFLSAGVLLAAVSVLCIVLAMLAGALVMGGWLRIYSLATLAAYALLTIVGFASRMQPRIGFQERLMAYTWMFWLGLLAVVLLSRRTAS